MVPGFLGLAAGSIGLARELHAITRTTFAPRSDVMRINSRV